MALNTNIVGRDEVKACWIDDGSPRGSGELLATGAMAFFAAYIPFRGRPCPNVVVDRVAPIAERTSRPLRIVGGIEWRPPVRPLSDEVRTPHFVINVPLGW